MVQILLYSLVCTASFTHVQKFCSHVNILKYAIAAVKTYICKSYVYMYAQNTNASKTVSSRECV